MTDFASIAAELAPQSQGAKGGSSFSDIAAELKGGHLKNSGFSANGIPVDPNADITPTPDKPKAWWQKYLGAQEAGIATVTGATLGPIGGAAAVGGRVLNNVKDLIMGRRPDGNLEDAYAKGSEALTYAPRTEAGQEYTKDISNTLSDSGLIAIAPLAHVQSLGGAAPGIKAAAEPAAVSAESIAKPNYKMVNGELQQAPRTQPTGAAPSLQEVVAQASPETRAAVEQAAAKGIPVNPDVLQRHVEAESLPVPMRLTKGQATGDVHQISFEQNNRKSNPEFANRMNEQNSQLIQNMDAIRAKAAPDVTASNHVENGQALIDAYKKMDAPINEAISQNYKALKDANGGSFPLDGKSFVQNADAALHKELLYNEVPPGLRKTLDDFREGGEMTFENFESLRTNLARIQRSPTADGNVKAAAGVIRNALEELPMPPGAEHLKPLADKARASAKARFDKINADPAYKAAINDGVDIGDSSPLADKFIENYVVNGKRANVANMTSNLAEDPLAKQTISAGVLDYLKHSSGVDLRTNTGNVSQSGYNKALTKVSPKSDLVFDPETGKLAQQLGNVARYTQEQPRGSYVNNSNTLTAMAAEKAAWGAEKLGNMAVPWAGLGTDARNYFARRKVNKAVEDSLSPGAGLTKLSDVGK